MLVQRHARRKRRAVQLDVQIPRARDLHRSHAIKARKLRLQLRRDRPRSLLQPLRQLERDRQRQLAELDLRRLLHRERLHLHAILHAKDLLNAL